MPPFHYLMDLHYSQTYSKGAEWLKKFHYLMDLHYSQTWRKEDCLSQQFHYLMDLHYSQTGSCLYGHGLCFTTLWIYTILKPNGKALASRSVSLPYGFTLFSNPHGVCSGCLSVSLPYGFTLFSNHSCVGRVANGFHYLMDLHYSQTRWRSISSAHSVSLPYGFTLFSNLK